MSIYRSRSTGSRDLTAILTTSIRITEVRKPPDVSQPDSKPNHGEDELQLVAPAAPVRLAICFFHLMTIIIIVVVVILLVVS